VGAYLQDARARRQADARADDHDRTVAAVVLGGGGVGSVYPQQRHPVATELLPHDQVTPLVRVVEELRERPGLRLLLQVLLEPSRPRDLLPRLRLDVHAVDLNVARHEVVVPHLVSVQVIGRLDLLVVLAHDAELVPLVPRPDVARPGHLEHFLSRLQADLRPIREVLVSRRDGERVPLVHAERRAVQVQVLALLEDEVGLEDGAEVEAHHAADHVDLVDVVRLGAAAGL